MRSASYLECVFDPSIAIAPAAILNISAPRLSEHSSFEVGIAYLKNSYQSHFYDYNGYTISNQDVTIDISQLKIPLGYRYQFRGGAIEPFIQAGITASFYLSVSTLWIMDEQYADGSTRYEENPVRLSLNSKQLGFYGGAGIMKKITPEIGGYLRFSAEANNGILRHYVNDDNLTNSVIINLQLSAGIYLWIPEASCILPLKVTG